MELETRVCWEQRIFTALLAEEQVKQQSKHKEYYYVYMHAPGQELAVSIPFCVCKQLSFLVHLIDPFGFVFAKLVLVQPSYATIKVMLLCQSSIYVYDLQSASANL